MAATAWVLSRFFLLIASLLALSASTFAQNSTSSASTTAQTTIPSSTTATIAPGTSPWAYYGCYNETTLVSGSGGLRALNGGVEETLDTMTAPLCQAYCKTNSYSFAGIEYSKECWCANYVSALSNKLPDSSCDLPCAGNSSQICGGNLALTIYQVSSSTSTSTKNPGVKGVRDAPVSSILALGIAIAVLLCLA